MAAADTGFRQQVREEFLSCRICFETFRQPKILPCVHTFCEKCLLRHAGRRQSFNCPTCRREIALPQNGVAGLEDNHFIASLTETFKATVVQRGPDPAAPADRCLVHPDQLLNLFCGRCEVMVCGECVNEEHDGHVVTGLRGATTLRRKNIFALLQNGREQTETLCDLLRRVNYAEGELLNSHRKAKSDIHDNGRENTSESGANLSSAEGELDVKLSRRMAELQTTRGSLLQHLGELAAACERAGNVVTEDDYDMLCGEEDRLSEVVSETRRFEVPELCLFYFIPTHAEENGGENIGEVIMPLAGPAYAPPSPGVSRSPWHTPPSPRLNRSPRLSRRQNRSHQNTEVGGPGFEPGRFAGPASAIISDSLGYVVDRGNKRIQVFNMEGDFVSEFSTRTVGDRRSSIPNGIAADSENQLWVTTSSGDVTVYDTRGCHIKTVKTNGEPWGIAYDVKNDRVMITDVRQHCVVILRTDGSPLATLGTMGRDDYQFDTPSYVAVNLLGDVIVSDCRNHCVKVFDESGRFMFRFGGKGSEDGRLSYPRGVCADESGNIIVADYGNDRVELFDSNGKFLKHVASIEWPAAVALGVQGQLLVTNDCKHKMTIFSHYQRVSTSDSLSLCCSIRSLYDGRLPNV
ncbi:hypothetical protein Bbelb_393100 [Branchiostoma belcheri]|nr:hypothetical protein Bbelb_393100 [Branchiostoma belcheri]